MLHTVIRSSIESDRMADPQYSKTAARASADADPRDQRQDDVLRRYARLQRAIHAHLDRSAIAFAAGTALPARAPLRWCRCRTPARRKLHAWPCGYRRRPPSCRAGSSPSSGPITCTMPCLSLPRRITVDAEILAILDQLLHLRRRNFIHDRKPARRRGRAVVGGGDGQIRPAHFQTPGPQTRRRLAAT